MVHLWMCELSTEIFCCWVTRQCIFFGTLCKLLHTCRIMYLLGDCWSIYWLLCWPTLTQKQLLTEMSVEYLLSIDWHFGQVVFSCRSTDRPTVGQDSIGSLSAMWIVSRVSVRYQWCISRQFASPTIGRYIGQVMFTFGRVSAIKSVDSQQR